MNTQNTFHGFTASFICAVIENLPKNISSEKMQTWIDNPKSLQTALEKTLNPKPRIVILNNDDCTGEGKIKIRVIADPNSTFNRQTARFISVITQHIPVIHTELMELWIKNPNTLKEALKKTLDAQIIILDDVARR
jgi:hypothetical protein